MTIEDFETESPIERKLLAGLLPMLAKGATIETQVPAWTCRGRFRLDIVVKHGGWRVAIECEGREFHEGSGHADLVRDAACLTNDVCDAVLRFRGSDIAFDLAECLTWCVALCEGAFGSGFVTSDTAEGIWVVAQRILKGFSRPTYRVAFPLAEFYENESAIRSSAAVKVWGRTADHRAALIEVRHPDWSWVHMGPRWWSMAQLMEVCMEDLERDLYNDGSRRPRVPQRLIPDWQRG